MFDLSQLYVFPLFLVFCRLGMAFMVFPGISDNSINYRARLLAAIVVSVALWPLLLNKLPALPEQSAMLVYYVVGELAIGFCMGISARIFMGALSIAGEMIAFATGFQAATLFDPSSNSNTSAPTLFLMVTASTIILATNVHHVLIEGVVDSYQLFPPGKLPVTGDVLQAVLAVMQNFMIIGLKIAAPVVMVGFLGYVGFGIFNRLIPQLHVFFVAMPISITVGMAILSVSISMMMMIFMTGLNENVMLFNVQ